jgi:hypothetical protein
MALADRGQGIFQSLARVHPGITDEEEALKAAFEKVISGRAPEQRGNGLKFVRSVLSLNAGRGLACVSGGAFVFYGELGLRCLELLKKRISRVEGTVSLLVWSLK